MKVFPFIKMHGLGNDYVYIDCFLKNTAEIIAKTDFRLWHVPSLTGISVSVPTDSC